MRDYNEASRRVADFEALNHVRSQGIVRLGFKQRGDYSVIAEHFQEGCLKVRLPRTAPGEPPCATLINTSGGLCDGDSLLQQVTWGRETRAVVTTQSAEKVYRALTSEARVETRLNIGNGADAEWLPQETILFDQARLTRNTQVTMADDASFLGVEAVVLGRAAMGEVMIQGALLDTWRIWRGGRLVYADALRMAGSIDDLMQRAAVGAGARAMAVLIHVSDRAASLLARVREALGAALGMASASAWGALLVTRLLARDGTTLRHDTALALSALRGGRPLPRVWGC